MTVTSLIKSPERCQMTSLSGRDDRGQLSALSVCFLATSAQLLAARDVSTAAAAVDDIIVCKQSQSLDVIQSTNLSLNMTPSSLFWLKRTNNIVIAEHRSWWNNTKKIRRYNESVMMCHDVILKCLCHCRRLAANCELIECIECGRFLIRSTRGVVIIS